MDHSLEDRVSALERRFAQLDEARRKILPDEVWNRPEVQAARVHQANHFFECLRYQVEEAERAIERKHQEIAEVGDEYAEFGCLLQAYRAEGCTDSEAEMMAAVEMYENHRRVPAGFLISETATGHRIERRR